MDIRKKLEEVTQALVAAAGRGDLDEAAGLIAQRATLIQGLSAVVDKTAGSRLELIRSAGERAATMLRSERARDAMCLERLRHVAATSAGSSSNTSINCIG